MRIYTILDGEEIRHRSQFKSKIKVDIIVECLSCLLL